MKMILLILIVVSIFVDTASIAASSGLCAQLSFSRNHEGEDLTAWARPIELVSPASNRQLSENENFWPRRFALDHEAYLREFAKQGDFEEPVLFPYLRKTYRIFLDGRPQERQLALLKTQRKIMNGTMTHMSLLFVEVPIVDLYRLPIILDSNDTTAYEVADTWFDVIKRHVEADYLARNSYNSDFTQALLSLGKKNISNETLHFIFKEPTEKGQRPSLHSFIVFHHSNYQAFEFFDQTSKSWRRSWSGVTSVGSESAGILAPLNGLIPRLAMENFGDPNVEIERPLVLTNIVQIKGGGEKSHFGDILRSDSVYTVERRQEVFVYAGRIIEPRMLWLNPTSNTQDPKIYSEWKSFINLLFDEEVADIPLELRQAVRFYTYNPERKGKMVFGPYGFSVAENQSWVPHPDQASSFGTERFVLFERYAK